MAILEAILEELKLLNQNLSGVNMESSTTQEPNIKKTVDEVPAVEKETDKPTQKFTHDYVMSLGKKFVMTVADEEKDALKTKLTELGADKLSLLSPDHYPEIVEYLKAKIGA
ncbi:hypothetical protein IHC73_000490 [Staphylococcus pseudintermedius]|uniref:hypothetical protein n=1 Tax=Staphylococcus pseudintermedius TaxID=283734 RepID=UPI00111DBE35|nr:hypothetical protein [Staphylococcus pseudintermedius]EGQ1753752.1 hypothetical protein [Staphylococcus pseudintermedius]EGQ2702782.1 hypothetical protein [Staphylococcus pseudintermedius]EGQ2813978.1 hypothetical protein [Staphylococcus pseudintermedius]EGQ2962410.1 hypothetical protein [Staphylococcus pseudintermedius]EGQ3219972.1 hypothetical protein [Staphylococcus pseudintermedius]